MIKSIFLLITIFSANLLNAQSKKLDSLLINENYNAAKNLINDYKEESSFNSNTYNTLIGKWFTANKELDSAFYYLLRVDTLYLKKEELGFYWYDLGRIYSYVNEVDKAIFYKFKAAEDLLKKGHKRKANEINYDLYYTYSAQQQFQYKARSYLDSYYENATSFKDLRALIKAHTTYAVMNWSKLWADSARYHFDKAFALNKIYGDSLLEASIHQYKGLFYTYNTSYKDSALYHTNIAYEFYKALKKPNRIFSSLGNKAAFERAFGNYKKAIVFSLQADTIPITEFVDNRKKNLYYYLSKDYEALGNYQSAYAYLDQYKFHTDRVNVLAQNTNLTRLRTVEAEKKVIDERNKSSILDKQRIRNRNIYMILSILLISVVIITFLIFQNIKRKQKLIEQEKLLQQQKIEQLLKDQELHGIDAMIEGQEKERQRIANDLHDNLGSLLATLKLHFQNLKVKKDRLKNEEDNLLEKTDTLIEEAYQKVRGIAHARNAGVIASEGLLPAVRNFAAKVSATNQLVIEVLDHGLEQRLENSLEITLFRIIQELITNIIKHAGASEATIQLTHHEDSINMMVEDNGKGFNFSAFQPKEGMGLYSIQKRVENLNGTLNIDTAAGRSTSIIIDIPIL